ncbi:MAG: glycine--tRNA ligase [Candidatus Anstonellales archaeon]
MKLYERIMELALTRSFFFPSNEIYGAQSGFYDYGPTGKLIKNNLENLWRRMFIQEEGFFEVETAVINPEIVFKASGHVDEFTDPVVECRKCHKKVRADHLVEERLNVRWDGKLESLEKLIFDNDVKCPSCEGPLSKPFFSNLMFSTQIGVDGEKGYLRPETAQGIFTSFLRIFRNHGTKLPLGVAQIGKSFRNEISPRKALVRLREFTQMELEYFFDPDDPRIQGFEKIKDEKVRFLTREAQKNKIDAEWLTAKEIVEKGYANEIMAYFLVRQWLYYVRVGLDPKRMWFRHLMENETPHYSRSNVDLEVETSYGIIEISGNAYRTNYDLSQHEKFSKQKMEVAWNNKKIVPHVFEVSMGVDRLFFCLLEHNFREKTDEKDWEWFDFKPWIAPYDVAVFPLMKKDGLSEKAERVADGLRGNFNVHYQESGTIGKRYARADEIGIPYAITIDYQTLEDETVTIRFRNSGKQERVGVGVLAKKIEEYKKEGRTE